MARPQPRPPVPSECPPGARWIALTRGLFALVDEDDYDRVAQHTWCADERKHVTYAVSGSNGHGRRRLLLHQFVMGVSGRVLVDHRNGDGLDNRRDNLRVATSSQNNANGRKHLVGAASRFKGVTRIRGGRWRARIIVNYQEVLIGHFDTEQQAADAYDAAAVKFFGEFARTNQEGTCVIS